MRIFLFPKKSVMSVLQWMVPRVC